MDNEDVMILAEAIAQAVAEALSGVTISVDGAELGRAAAEAINRNRASEGRMALEL